jgi:hypothetical protein
MPDSIRELLQGIAGDEPVPSGDLAAGAYRRARRIGRRRLAAAAVAAVTGLMLASATTAALVNANGVEEAPPAAPTAFEEPTASEESTGHTAAPDEYESTPEASDVVAETCAGPVDWTGWGPSNSNADLDELPEALFFEVHDEDAMEQEIVRWDREVLTSTYSGGEYRLAPDGERYVLIGDGECDDTLGMLEGDSIEGLGLPTDECSPSWSPYSDQVVLNAPDAESAGGYLLDVATGESRSLPAAVGCSPRWSADGSHLFSDDGGVGMALDGGQLFTLEGAEQWLAEPGFRGLSSISADLTRACLEFGATADADEGESSAELTSWDFGADRCDRYVDTATGAELELPVDSAITQVVFLPDGSKIVCGHHDDWVKVSLVDADETVQDVRSLPRVGSTEMMLRGYFTG